MRYKIIGNGFGQEFTCCIRNNNISDIKSYLVQDSGYKYTFSLKETIFILSKYSIIKLGIVENIKLKIHQ